MFVIGCAEFGSPMAAEAEVPDVVILGWGGGAAGESTSLLGVVRSLGGLCEWTERQTVVSTLQLL